MFPFNLLAFRQSGATTPIHCDAADAINICFYGSANWVIFPAKDTPKLEQFLQRGKDVPEDYREIFSGQHILNDKQLKELASKYNVIPQKILQKAGQAIVIPAGCAHQVTDIR